ncbi:beta-hexosaminidase [Psychrosphaera saromensis]|uniref:beta-N-acetylhexosaminidase n=1 Tax=Psychrosphaera saromensis TaxID=716813 RepID=A0A2S7UWC3_9GAMM|nr:beta-N-acetylhexosaminidase [Psychrosphaera saromensis]PQJ54284.1 beta-N-acetylhexosaminidase [Psychrosphaera saromensis]GHB74557.1 beta-hexosaminidase [Psychrosphaera saromensis]GLQ12614.1 beta-hexosaminidase [Psychrosphaera saromensis]
MINQSSVMMDLEGTVLAEDEKVMLASPLVGGLILFSRNFDNSKQLTQLIKDVRQAAKQPIVIAVDNEGGRVQRFKTDGFTPIPAMGKLAPFFEKAVAAKGEVAVDKTETVSELAWLLASECFAHGIDVSFSPVLDLERGSDVIGDRSFNSDIKLATELATYWCDGLADAGMACIGKHFPGHGSTKEDTHVAAPVDTRSFAELEQNDMAIFKTMIANNKLQGMMPAHIRFSAVDDNPVGYSEYWLQTVLKQKLGFNGVIFSDDLSMVGAGEHLSYAEKALKAVTAGCDMVLICNDKNAVKQVLSELQHKVTDKQSNALSLLSNTHIDLDELQASKRWRNAVNLAQAINQPR